jgi:hypothetical protein
MAVRVAHQGDKGEIDDKDPKANGQKQKRFVFFCYGKVNKKTAHSPHDNELELEVKYPGRVQNAV